MNQLIEIEFIFQKNHRKKLSICCHLYDQNIIIMIIKNSTGPFLANQTKKEEVGPVEFLHFHSYNLNMNHKRKYLLNRSQEYQLPYLLFKEESF
ncbi:hypothetical protein ES332_D06G132500v1 [Gossypium tomentosum]|uniref:Uncharacterized protein n=1 Tax=Gossypium tomentosum TaxID=34277 RepID=A0A5D2KIT9_GOSTO|nr:hypothetical protein ES332_D06G132500v1 [Gossypium tomentosum]